MQAERPQGDARIIVRLPSCLTKAINVVDELKGRIRGGFLVDSKLMTYLILNLLGVSKEELTEQMKFPLEESITFLGHAQRLFTMIGSDLVYDTSLFGNSGMMASIARMFSNLPPKIITVSAADGIMPMKAAVNSKGKALVFATTTPSPFDDEEIDYRLINPTYEQTMGLAKRAAYAGVDGLYCSTFELGIIKREPGFSHLLFMSPGVDLVGKNSDNPRPIMSIQQYICAGGDFPILDADEFRRRGYETVLREVSEQVIAGENLLKSS